MSVEIIKKIFSAFSMQRWNDHIKTLDLTELDKQSHKMIIAYLIGKIEEDTGKTLNWKGLIEGSIFETLHRMLLTDIKPPVYYEISKEHRNQLNEWVIEQLGDLLKTSSDSFYENFCKYFRDENYCSYEKKILAAAHFIATEYEFNLIYPANLYTYKIEETKERIERTIEKHLDMEGVRRIRLYKNYKDFIKICGQLRFQKRWAQLSRVPDTTVLGHMYYVAVISYFFSIKSDLCSKRFFNNFFTALFHDLPEVLTRDIITPVKTSIPGLDEVIKEIEAKEMEQMIYPLLEKSLSDELKYFTSDEFSNRIIVDNKTVKLDDTLEALDKFNFDKYSGVDGKMLKICDHLAAYMEATVSVNYHGMKSIELTKAMERLELKYKNIKVLGVDISELMCQLKMQ